MVCNRAHYSLVEMLLIAGLLVPFTAGTHGGTSGFEFPPYPTDNYHVSLAVAVDRLRSLVALLTSLLRYAIRSPSLFL